MRTKLDNEEEFKMLEKVVKRYKFNLVDEELEEMHRLQTTTKKLYLEEPSQMSGEDDDDVILASFYLEMFKFHDEIPIRR
jgi:hypothetical protein